MRRWISSQSVKRQFYIGRPFSSTTRRSTTAANSRFLASQAANVLAAAAVVTTAVGVVVVGTHWHLQRPIQNDVSDTFESKQKDKARTTAENLPSAVRTIDDVHLSTVAWGSNKSNFISPDTPEADSIKKPRIVAWLSDVALRDLALHERYGVCVDARGDVYHWGSATASSKGPVMILRGKDITSVQLTASRPFALSSSGKIYVLPCTGAGDASDAPPQIQPRSSFWSLRDWLPKDSQPVGFAELGTAEKFGRGEKFVSISAGTDHLLALTSTGRTFTHPLSKDANSHGQLGLRKFDLPGSDSRSPSSPRVPIELVPKAVADPYAKAAPFTRTVLVSPAAQAISDSADPSVHFCDRLFEVPSLKGIKIAQAVAGSRSSFVRTAEEGRVLAWGANEFGQLGLGSAVTIDTITVPTEVVLSRSTPTGTRSHCFDIVTGGDLTYFMVERRDVSSSPTFDLLACGMGQWGGLGNGLYSTAQGTPGKVKAISGLVEYSEGTKSLEAIMPHTMSVSATGHVLLTMDTLARTGPGAVGGGRDLFVWGLNRDYQLGTGKRTSIATPTAVDGLGGGRLMLLKRKADVKDMAGRTWRRSVDVEQRAVAGHGLSVVYWRIC